MNDETFSTPFFEKNLKVIQSYEQLDVSITYCISCFINKYWDQFEFYLKKLPEYKVIHRIDILLDACLFELNSLSNLYTSAILMDLIGSILNLYNYLAIKIRHINNPIPHYFIRSIKRLLDNIYNNVFIFRFTKLNIYKRSSFKTSLDLFARLLYLIPSTKIYLSHLVREIEELKILVAKINNKLIYIYEVYLKILDRDLGEEVYIAWDVISRLKPIKKLVNLFIYS